MLLLLAVFITANVSGGHLNPAVTLATMFTGHIKIVRGLAYIFLQICGACFGILMVVSTRAHLMCLISLSAWPPNVHSNSCNLQSSSPSSSKQTFLIPVK